MKLKVLDEEVDLSEEKLTFNEVNVNEFLQKVGGWFAYYNAKAATVKFIMDSLEDKYDKSFAAKFNYYKKLHECSDKAAEAYAKNDDDVSDLLHQFRLCEKDYQSINGFLKALNLAQQSCQNFCWNLRKEMQMTGQDSVRILDSIIN